MEKDEKVIKLESRKREKGERESRFSSIFLLITFLVSSTLLIVSYWLGIYLPGVIENLASSTGIVFLENISVLIKALTALVFVGSLGMMIFPLYGIIYRITKVV